tara:strand:+ start:3272 stop:4441 length:1170 start_codon:yes stop_codon:yes gene_type:complete
MDENYLKLVTYEKRREEQGLIARNKLRKANARFCDLSQKIFPFVCEPIQVYGLERLTSAKGIVIGLNHESRWDGVVLPAVWDQFPEDFAVQGPMRHDPLGEFGYWTGLNWVIRRVLRNNVRPIYRRDMIKSEGEVDVRYEEDNKVTMSGLKEGLHLGLSIVIMVDQTSKSNGNLLGKRFKSGLYNLAMEGSSVLVGSNTWDYMAGDDGKKIVCLNFGEPFRYEAKDVPFGLDEEALRDWKKKVDIPRFKDLVRKKLVRATVMTTAMLAGEAMVESAARNRNPEYNSKRLREVVLERRDQLEEEGYLIEKRLEEDVDRRLDNFSVSLRKQVYVRDEGGRTIIDSVRTLREVSDEKMKKSEGNILLYHVNRLKGLAALDDRVEEILKASVL